MEVSRGDLVGRYTGHTAPLTNSVIESALGGVLFIDEAYSLYRGEQDSFGLEAIDTLVKGMEDHRDDLVVILAGYTREMQQFLSANSGLASRFPNQIEFPDYTADQLLDITVSLASARGYRLDDSCTFPLLGYYQRRQGGGQPHRRQRPSGPQHPGKGHLQPEPPPGGRARRAPGPDPGGRPGIGRITAPAKQSATEKAPNRASPQGTPARGLFPHQNKSSVGLHHRGLSLLYAI